MSFKARRARYSKIIGGVGSSTISGKCSSTAFKSNSSDSCQKGSAMLYFVPSKPIIVPAICPANSARPLHLGRKFHLSDRDGLTKSSRYTRSEERRVGKECRSR